MMHDAGGWTSWWTVMWAAMIVMWTVVIAAMWAVFASLRGRDPGTASEELLARRLARGEIGREEYVASLQALRERRSGRHGEARGKER